MNLYISSHSQEEALAVAKICRDAGHKITSTWLYEDFSKTHLYTDTDKRDVATKDVTEVAGSDAMVFMASPRRIAGGKFVECGVALALGKPVFLLGHRENMLMYHPLVTQFNSAEDFIKSVQ